MYMGVYIYIRVHAFIKTPTSFFIVCPYLAFPWLSFFFLFTESFLLSLMRYIFHYLLFYFHTRLYVSPSFRYFHSSLSLPSFFCNVFFCSPCIHLHLNCPSFHHIFFSLFYSCTPQFNFLCDEYFPSLIFRFYSLHSFFLTLQPTAVTLNFSTETIFTVV